MGAGGGSTVGIIAAIHARRVRETMDAFRLADATAPGRAKTLDEVGATHRLEIDTLARDGILVHDPRTDAWWLDERAHIAFRDRQPKRAVKAVLAVVIVLLVIMLVTLLATARRTARPGPVATPGAASGPR